MMASCRGGQCADERVELLDGCAVGGYEEVVCAGNVFDLGFELAGGHVSDLFFISGRRRHTSCLSDWSSDVCSSDLGKRSPTSLRRTGTPCQLCSTQRPRSPKTSSLRRPRSTDSPGQWFLSATATAGLLSLKLATIQRSRHLYISLLSRPTLGKARPALSSPCRQPARGSRKRATVTYTLTRQPFLPTSVRIFRRLKLSLWLSHKFYFPRTHSQLQLLLQLGSRNPVGTW